MLLYSFYFGYNCVFGFELLINETNLEKVSRNQLAVPIYTDIVFLLEGYGAESWGRFKQDTLSEVSRELCGRAVVGTTVLPGPFPVEEEPDVPWQIRGGSQRKESGWSPKEGNDVRVGLGVFDI